MNTEKTAMDWMDEIQLLEDRIHDLEQHCGDQENIIRHLREDRRNERHRKTLEIKRLTKTIEDLRETVSELSDQREDELSCNRSYLDYQKSQAVKYELKAGMLERRCGDYERQVAHLESCIDELIKNGGKFDVELNPVPEYPPLPEESAELLGGDVLQMPSDEAQKTA